MLVLLGIENDNVTRAECNRPSLIGETEVISTLEQPFSLARWRTERWSFCAASSQVDSSHVTYAVCLSPWCAAITDCSHFSGVRSSWAALEGCNTNTKSKFLSGVRSSWAALEGCNTNTKSK